MKYLHVFICGLILAQSASAQTAKAKAEIRLNELLAPSQAIPTVAAESVPWKSPKQFTEFTLPIRSYVVAPVRLPAPASAAVKPRSAPEGTPLLSYREQAKGPKEVELPTEPLIKVPSVDVTTPLSIPILAQSVKDRASLGDPAAEASLAAALKRLTPTRTEPVPFVPLNLPDPFEHVRYGQIRNPPAENANPPVIPWTKPLSK